MRVADWVDAVLSWLRIRLTAPVFVDLAFPVFLWNCEVSSLRSVMPVMWDAMESVVREGRLAEGTGGPWRLAVAAAGRWSRTPGGACCQMASDESCSRQSRDCWTEVSMWITSGRPGILSRNRASLLSIGLMRSLYLLTSAWTSAKT